MIVIGVTEFGVDGPALFFKMNRKRVFMYLSISRNSEEQSEADRRREFLLMSIESYSYLGLNYVSISKNLYKIGFSIASYIKMVNFKYLFNSSYLSFINSWSLLKKILFGGKSLRLSAALVSKSSSKRLCILSKSLYLLFNIQIYASSRTSIK